jgi:hypothetical protein
LCLLSSVSSDRQDAEAFAALGACELWERAAGTGIFTAIVLTIR